MSHATPATRALDTARQPYRLHDYAYDPAAANIGRHAAAALGADPARMFKTLMVALDGKPACAILPVDHELSLKKFAAALGGKHATMLPAADAERITGYRIGGISPFGRRKAVPVALDASALPHATLLCNGGQRGLMIEVAPQVVVEMLSAIVAPIAADA
ncbi:MAG: Cys-tRNA(Pro) deacylase [Xanthomonadaceae bacterium]|jgi:Cys-tRNA(Pro)/Cys-tRNA(Cys) deacylase|nr:Cys-tRNA(Pro) deacylase [Xanthomonadaceae bacterium]